jgi:hypothetical protein
VNVVLTMMAKTLATEKYAEKGWFGFIERHEDGQHHFVGIYTRQAMAKEVMEDAKIHGADFLTSIRDFPVPKGNKTIFVPFRDAKTADDAAQIIIDNMANFCE